MFSVYAIKNDKNIIYVGHSENLEERLARHNKELPTKKKSFTYKIVVNGTYFIKKNIQPDKKPSEEKKN